MNSRTLLIILLLIISLPINAQVVLDGTLGHSGPLPGPDYQIKADLGQQHGGNLFHSFQDFNLSSHESATFSGPNSVNNVISRVTGGNPSNIDGLLRSTIPNADMYFLNPYGIMFGPNARLDVQGSFHASTADTLRLQDGGRFDARQPGNSLLTVAPVEAFGFLTNTPAAITTEDSDLSVPENQTLSLIGGDLRLKSQSPIQFDEDGFAAIFARSKLSAVSGRINLASVASRGEIIPHESELDLNGEGGTITANNTLIDVSGRGSGEVFIRGGELAMQDSTIQASTLADLNGKNIDMRLSESIDIRGDLLAVLNQTFGSGNGGGIVIKAPRLEVTESWITAANTSTGSGGNIDIEATQVLLKEGGTLFNETYGSGSSGNLHLKVKETLLLSGRRTGNITRAGITWKNFPSLIESATFNEGKTSTVTIETNHLNLVGGIIGSNSFGRGDANEVIIHANTAKLTDGALITSTAFAFGRGGNIKITIEDTLSVSGQRSGLLLLPFGIRFENNESGITSGTFSTGQAGHVFIEANTLLLAEHGFIFATSGGDGTAGKVSIKAKVLHLTNRARIGSSSGDVFGSQVFAGSGDGGNIVIQADHLLLTNDSTITAKSLGTGNAGDILVSANTINLTGQSAITTEAKNAAGGNISVTTPNLLYVRGGQITTSVGTGKGRGGDITISGPVFVVLDKGQIKAQTDEGHGGNIRITSDQFIKSSDSLVSASSRLGLDGSVNIDSPDMNLDQFLVVLPGGFIENAQLPPSCNIQELSELSTFEVRTQYEGLLRMPRDFME